jgi:hypothetical protein
VPIYRAHRRFIGPRGIFHSPDYFVKLLHCSPLQITWKSGDPVPIVAYLKYRAGKHPMVGLINTVQNERYVSGIFNNEEKICNKY